MTNSSQSEPRSGRSYGDYRVDRIGCSGDKAPKSSYGGYTSRFLHFNDYPVNTEENEQMEEKHHPDPWNVIGLLILIAMMGLAFFVGLEWILNLASN